MKLLIVDDHPIFRKGLAGIIKSHLKNSVITEAEDGKQALEIIKRESFDLYLLDIDMPKLSGLDVLSYIQKNKIPGKAIIFSMHNDELFFNEALDRGAMGYVLKEDSSVEINECIDYVLSGTPFVSKKLKSFIENRQEFSSQIHEIKAYLNTLTKTELGTLKLVAQNRTSKEIAELLFVTEKSVENYRSRICKKLKLSGESHVLNKWAQQYKSLLR